ncbi:hypothetical protein ELS19_06830 [Halogeometricum borinquense]|uniref:Sulfatase N-terminal domain-containing protein n=1 Tax=Halogeometricum borinquense TaxID=60847 RepID=A0A482TA16_9EURY|nr:sulfatase [Halogeometricum borinquense]RYJ13707.1 hypothetical protein ELS19_06830 [Halogeometricum borinquense]
MTGTSRSDPTNLLFISVDSLRRDYSSLYGSDETTMPFLASQSDATVFDRAISPSIWTLQVHGSVFTGLYPPEHGVLNKGRALGDHPTLAEILSAKDYSAKSFGKNGWLESGDILRGFDHHRPDVSAHVSKQFEDAIDDLRDRDLSTLTKVLGDGFRAASEKIKRQLFRHTPVADASVDLLLEHLDNEDGPFCYFLHTNDVHYVYNPVAPYHTMFGDHSFVERYKNRSYQQQLVDGRGEIYTGQFEFDPTANEVMRDLYRGCIRQTDALLERLFTELQRRDVYENTVIVLFGDHGEHLCDGGHFGHQLSVADQLIRVPLLIWDPTNTLEAGHRSDVVQLNDLYPTLASIVDVEVPETRSVDVTNSTRETAYVYYSCPDSLVERIEATVDRCDLPPLKQYAAWENPDKKVVWYPDEERFAGPCAEDESMRELLRTHESSLVPIERRTDGEMSDSVEQNLRELGYL